MPTLIIKVTEKCNANCAYCYVVHKKHNFSTMPDDVLEAIFSRVDEYLKSNSNEYIDILWHGGEPLLAGKCFFEKALKFQYSICATTKNRINHSIQTNLTLLTKVFISIFQELGVNSIGTSIDPIPNIRGIGKKNNSEKYNKYFMQALRILDRASIHWGIVYVVTKKSLEYPLKLFFYLTNLASSGVVNLNPVLCFNERNSDIAISPQEYSDFLGQIFPYWWEHRWRYPRVQPYKGLVESIVDKTISPGCMDFGTCESAFLHINVEANGYTSQSGFTATDKPVNYGNILDKSIQMILFNSKSHQLEEEIQRKRKKECIGCRLAALCNPHNLENKSYLVKKKWCESRLGFISNYFEPITGVKYEPVCQC